AMSVSSINSAAVYLFLDAELCPALPFISERKLLRVKDLADHLNRIHNALRRVIKMRIAVSQIDPAILHCIQRFPSGQSHQDIYLTHSRTDGRAFERNDYILWIQ